MKPTPKYLSRTKLVRYGSVKKLTKREKKPARVKKTMRLGEQAEAEWFALYAHLYGLQAAVKRFGKDMREMAA